MREVGLTEFTFQGYVLQPVRFKIQAETEEDAYEKAEALEGVIEGLQDVALVQEESSVDELEEVRT